MILERQLILVSLVGAFGLFVLGVLAMMDHMIAAATCWGLSAILVAGALLLWMRVQLARL